MSNTLKNLMDLGCTEQQLLEAAKQINTSKGFYTPNIIEESKENITLLSIFDYMARQRILFLTGGVNDSMSTIVTAQLLYFDSLDPNKPITAYVDSPGGSVKSGLTIYDTMNFIDAPVLTVVTGYAASMGSIIASSGEKGRRTILPNAKFMLHQVSSGTEGTVADQKISLAEAEKYNEILFGILAENSGKDKEQIKLDATRDLWLTADEAVDYGLVDYKITSKKQMRELFGS